MKTRVFLRRPEVPGRCPSNGVVWTVCTLPSLIGVTARPSHVVDDCCGDSLCRSRFGGKTSRRVNSSATAEAPKGRHVIARGNAPGKKSDKRLLSPEGAK